MSRYNTPLMTGYTTQPMKINITNGTGHIAVGLSDVGSYIKIDKPVSLVWPDRGGSVAEYLCMMPMAPGEREKIHDLIMDSLYNDYTHREQDLYEMLKPLLQLLQNGEYDLSYRAAITQPEPADGEERKLTFAWFTEWPTRVELNRMDQLKRDYKAECKKFDREESTYGLIEFTSSWVYHGGGAHRYVATRPFDDIDDDQVRYFERQIAQGARPWVLVMRAIYLPEHIWSADFILDGHHKLQAYNKLGINPPVATITQHIHNEDDKTFDAEALADQLYPWQMRHILNHWHDHEKDKFVIQKLKNPDSPLHKHIRNGLLQEFYDNKQLRQEAFYINDKPHGQVRNWYENGQLKSEHYYNRGKRINTWKEYFPSGNIEIIRRFNDEDRHHGLTISYYENGQKRRVNEYENGLTKDGASSQTWYADGSPEYEATYLAGRQVEVKRWNSYGKITEHSVFDAETQKFKKIDNPEPIQTPASRQVYQNTAPFRSDDDIRGNGQNFERNLVILIVILLFVYLFWWMGQPL